MATLENQAQIDAMLDTTPVSAKSSIVTVQMTRISLIKAADKEIWDDGEVLYTITARSLEPPLPEGEIATGVTLTDVIDPDLATLVPGSVRINGAEPTDPSKIVFNEATGLLTIELDDIEQGESVVVTFLVKKV